MYTQFAVERKGDRFFTGKDPTESKLGNLEEKTNKSIYEYKYIRTLEYCIKHRHLVLHPLTLLRRYRDVT